MNLVKVIRNIFRGISFSFKKISYLISGNYFSKIETKSKNNFIKKSRLGINFSMYLSVLFLFILIIFFIFLIQSVLICIYYFKDGFQITNSFLIALISSVLLCLISSFLVTLIFIAFPYLKIKEQEDKIDKNISLFMHVMFIFVSAGANMDEIMKNIIDIDIEPEIKNECKNILNETQVFGTDICTAIENTRITMCSKRLNSFFEGIENILITGGNMAEYIKREKENENQLIELRNKENDKKTDLFCEVFILGFLAAPLFFLLMIFTVFSIGNSQFDLMKFIVYNMIPVLGVFFVALTVLSFD